MKAILAAAAVAAMFAASPASAAATLCSTGGFADLTGGCRALGNDDEADTEAAIEQATGAFVDLTLYGKSDDDDDFDLFTFYDGPDQTGNIVDFATLQTLLDGSWSVNDGTLIQYLTVKAGPEFLVFELPGAGSATGNFSTLGIEVGRNGNQPELSHLSFWTAGVAIPEPATWAMLITGFGLVGGAMRRRDRISTAIA